MHRHVVERGDLHAALERVVGVAVAPPVKARNRVGEERVGRRLRKEHDNLVVLGPLPVAGILVVHVANRALVLRAAVKRNVQAARGARLARARHVHVRRVAERRRQIRPRRREEVGRRQRFPVGGRRLRGGAVAERAVEVLQHHAGAVVVAVVEVGRRRRRARDAVVERRHAVAGVNRVLGLEVALRRAELLQLLAEVLHHLRVHRRVRLAREQVHLHVRQVAHRINFAVLRKRLRVAHQRRHRCEETYFIFV